MNLYVTVLHNVGPDMFMKYQPGVSELYYAHTFALTADNAEKAANLVWMLANVGDVNELRSMRPDLAQEYGAQVTSYRRYKNRSLSVGDVLVIQEVGDEGLRDDSLRFVAALAIEMVGHTVLDERPISVNHPQIDPTVSPAYEAHQRLLR